LTATGKLSIAILHAQNLKNSITLGKNPQNIVLRPFVRISLLEDNKEIQNTGRVSEIISKEENLDDDDEVSRDPNVFASWVNQRNNLGQIFDLGIF
jgi:hypothetical protein